MLLIKIRFYLLPKKAVKQLKQFLRAWFTFNRLFVGFISVKRKKKLFSLTKSPHIFKKSQQHYNSSFYKVTLLVYTEKVSITNKLLLYVLARVDILFFKFKVYK